VWPKLLEFRLEELVLLVGYRLLVENQDIGDIVVVDLLFVSNLNLRLKRQGGEFGVIPCP
jgi:hypothetical protein